MRRILLVLALALLTVAAAAQSNENTLRVERPFENSGKVEMYLGGGAYTIRAGAADKIVVVCRAESDSDLQKAKADVNVVGRFAKVRTSGPHSNFRVTIEVPAETNLFIRLEAGDMRVRGITGNKDVESHAGTVDIEVGNASDYGKVDASVYAGDLNAGPFRVSKGGLFRSFRQTGNGKYTLHAHLGAGDLSLH